MFVRAGEVTCLFGDNGAGKSTLIKTLAGVHKPSEGEYRFEGEPVEFDSPRDALAKGIATVYQDLAMIPLMSIWRNFFLGSEPTKGFWPFRRFNVDFAKGVTREEMSKMGIDIRDADQPVGTLSGGERQSVAIARAVYFGAKVLILDEPTAALGVKQAGCRPALHPAGQATGHRSDLHHPQPAPRLPGRRPLRHPPPRPGVRRLRQGGDPSRAAGPDDGRWSRPRSAQPRARCGVPLRRHRRSRAGRGSPGVPRRGRGGGGGNRHAGRGQPAGNGAGADRRDG